MGAWGIGNFDNDDAADWVYELVESDRATLLETALRAVDSDEDYLEAPECSIALASAEVVAALLGAASPALPDEVRLWVDEHALEVDHNLLGLARAAVIRIRQDSELKELWEESGQYERWESVLNDLMRRLGAGE